MYEVKSQGSGHQAGYKKVGLRVLKNGVEQASPAEICEAKLDGVCPRCGSPVDLDGDSGLCHKCKFSF